MSVRVKLFYAILFLALVFSPHIFKGHVLLLSDGISQSLFNVIILLLLYLTYLLHQRELLQKQEQLECSSQQLGDAYKYIGAVNNRLPVLKGLTSALLKKERNYKSDKKDIFSELLAVAINSALKQDKGMFRFIDITTQRTSKEYYCAKENCLLLEKKISNRDLLQITRQELFKQFSDVTVFSTSDYQSSIRCFLIVNGIFTLDEEMLSMVQFVVDQAQLFYIYLHAAVQ